MRDFAEVRGEGFIDGATASEGLELFGVDELGLDKVDRAILVTLCTRFGGQPVGLTTLSQCVGEETDTIEDAYEPYLVQTGLDPAHGARPGGDPARLGPPRVRRSAERRAGYAAALLSSRGTLHARRLLRCATVVGLHDETK